MENEPEKSSEVKEQELAEEALDATAAPPAESEPGVPVAKHAVLRRRAQAAEVAQARAEGELNALRQAATTQVPAVKSPLELEIERQAAAGVAREDMTVSPDIIIEQQTHTQRIANQATQVKATRELQTKQLASTSRAKIAHEDWQQVVGAAFPQMTPGETLDIEREGDNFGEVAYAKAQEVIARNLTPETKTETAPETKTSESEADKVPTQQEVLDGLQADPATIAAAKL